jgi:hypothetical protein
LVSSGEQKVERGIEEAEAGISKNSLSLAAKRGMVEDSVSGSADIQDDAEVKKLFIKAAILKVSQPLPFPFETGTCLLLQERQTYRRFFVR